MIMKVRLAAMLKHRNRLKNVDILTKNGKCAENIFGFEIRTKAKTFGDRSKMILDFDWVVVYFLLNT